jgi:hypothetical protein
MLLHHLLLGLAVAALAAAGLRVASALAPSGLERAVSAAVLAATAAAAEALLLGLVGWGTSPAALSLAAAATWLAARLLVPGPELSPLAELLRWWRSAPLALRVSLGVAGGVWAAWALWLLRYPALGVDSVIYHLPEVAGWVQDGSPGSTLAGVLGEASNRPLVSEVLLSWGAGIARSFVPVSVYAPALMALLAAAGWLGLRTLGVARATAAAAVAAICLSPVLTHFQMNGAYTDLPALAWLVSCAALVAGSPARPALLVPALLAAGLAAGVKTTVLPMTLLVLVLAALAHRRRLAELRPLRGPLVAAALVAACLGGFWYLRDTVRHGSPFWPEVAFPWGDPAPVDASSVLDDPIHTLKELGDDYKDVFVGSALLLVGAMLAPLVARGRDVLLGAAATVVNTFLWMGAPATGVVEGVSASGTVAALRYLTPVLAVAATTLALASRGPRPARLYANGVLGVALAVSAWQTLDLGFPHVPGLGTIAAGALAGGAAAWALSRVRPHLPVPRGPAALALTALLAAAAGAALTPAASGYVERHARTNANTTYAGAGAVEWLAGRESFRNGSEPVGVFPIPNGMLAGDRLQHEVEVLPLDERCPGVRERARRGWFVVNASLVADRLGAGRCLPRAEAAFAGGDALVYAGEAVAQRPARAGETPVPAK